MRVKIRKKGHVTILECSGTLKAASDDDALHEALSKPLEDGDRFFVFDMAHVPWMDTAGITTVIAAHKHVAEKEGKIVLVLSQKVHDIFTVTQLSRVFEIHSDVEEALGSLVQ